MNGIKGFLGELKIRLAMWCFLWFGWKVYHNVTIQLSGGKTSQVDHVILSRAGVFVIETKNYKGLIRADEHSSYWTQVFKHTSYDFYSPVKQNNGHISALKYMLKTKKPLFFNLVCFVGEARFEGKPPPEVAIGVMGAVKAIKTIKRNHKKRMTKNEFEALARAITERRMPNTRKTKKIHLKNMKTRKHRE